MRIEAENNQRKNIGKDTKQRKVTEQKKVPEQEKGCRRMWICTPEIVLSSNRIFFKE